MKKRYLVLTLVMFIIGSFSVAFAQEDMTSPDPEMNDIDVIIYNDPTAQEVFDLSVDGATIESVTSESDEYYGEIVTLEGEIGEFVNSRIFALGESAAIDNDLVLVVNNSSETFDPRIMAEAHVIVTGRVHPSVVAINEGAQTDFGALFTVEEAEYDEETTATMMEEQGRRNMVQFAQNSYLAPGFDNYTIIEVVNIDNVEFVNFGRDDIGN